MSVPPVSDRAGRRALDRSPGFRHLRRLTTGVTGLVGAAAVLVGCGSGATDPAPVSSVASSGSSSAAPTAGTTSATPTAGSTGGSTDMTPTATPTASGGLSEVPTLPVTTAPAVPLASPATVAGVTVALGRITAFTGTGVLPGEVAGPAVAVPVTLRNGTGGTVSADDVVVDLVGASGAPAAPLSSPPANPLTGDVAPGAGVSGTYTFTLPQAERSNVSITVTYRAGVPVARFTGSVPT